MTLYEYISFLTGEDNKKFIMPVPLIGMINGGVQSSNDLTIQDVFIIPKMAESYSEAVRIGSECYYSLKNNLEGGYANSGNCGLTGGLTPNIRDVGTCLELVLKAAKDAGHSDKVVLGIDAGAQTFFDEDQDAYDWNYKIIKSEGHNYQSREEMIDFYQDLVNKYPIEMIEDPFDENDWEGYRQLSKKLDPKVLKFPLKMIRFK